MSTERDFLRKLEKAKTEDEKTWLTTKRLIDSLSEDMRTLVYSAAIPHWFDAKTLRALHPELSRKIRWLYPKLQKLSFVEPFEGRGHNIHELTRRLILDYLWKKQRRSYRSKSQVLANFYHDSARLAQKKIARKIKELGSRKDKKKFRREIQQWAKKNPEIVNAASSDFQIEYVYHLVIAQPKEGANYFQKMGWRWHDKFDYSFAELNGLIDSVGEHIVANRVKGRIVGWEKYFRGLLYFYRIENVNAAACFSDVIRTSFPDRRLNADVRYRLGNVHKRLSELPKALACYEEALPLYRAINNKLGEANCIRSIGDVHLRLSELPEARARYEEALLIYRTINSKLGEANCISSLGDVHLRLSELPEARARYEEALPIYRAINNKLSEAKCISSLGDVHLRLNEFDQAINAYKKAVELDPENFRRWYTLGEVYRDEDIWQDAIEAFNNAISLNKQPAYIWVKLGNVYRDHNLIEKAINAYETASNLDSKISEPHFELGHLYLRSQKYEEALDNFQKAIDLEPNEPYYRNHFGYTQFKLNKFEEALLAFDKAIEINPENGEFHYSRIRALRALDRNDEANKEIEITKSLIQKNDYYNQACFELICGNIDAALLLLGEAIKKRPRTKIWARHDPDFESIRNDPRFKELVGK